MDTTLDSPNQQDVLDSLESLIEINRDGQEGFRQAAEHAKDAELKSLFREYSSERAGFVSELQTLERENGKTDVDTSGTVVGSMHRAWINLRSAVASANDQAILEEAERGEDAAVEAYRDALNSTDVALPSSVTSVLQKQLTKVQAAHDDVRNRRDSGGYDVKDD